MDSQAFGNLRLPSPTTKYYTGTGQWRRLNDRWQKLCERGTNFPTINSRSLVYKENMNILSIRAILCRRIYVCVFVHNIFAIYCKMPNVDGYVYKVTVDGIVWRKGIKCLIRRMLNVLNPLI